MTLLRVRSRYPSLLVVVLICGCGSEPPRALERELLAGGGVVHVAQPQPGWPGHGGVARVPRPELTRQRPTAPELGPARLSPDGGVPDLPAPDMTIPDLTVPDAATAPDIYSSCYTCKDQCGWDHTSCYSMCPTCGPNKAPCWGACDSTYTWCVQNCPCAKSPSSPPPPPAPVPRSGWPC